MYIHKVHKVYCLTTIQTLNPSPELEIMFEKIIDTADSVSKYNIWQFSPCEIWCFLSPS